MNDGVFTGDAGRLLARFPSCRILVVGDIMLDEYVFGTVGRISPEAPVPVVAVTRDARVPGGAANVALNLSGLKAVVEMAGLDGNDPAGRCLTRALRARKIGVTAVVQDPDRPTTLKTRVVAHSQQVVRVDREETGVPERATLDALLAFLEAHLHEFDAVLVSDYAKGVVSEELMTRLHRLLDTIRARDGRPVPLIVDPKPVNLQYFTGATVITPNHHEAARMAGVRIEDERSLLAAARHIRDDLGCEAVLITRGEAGMALLEGDGPLVTIPTMAKEVYDVTGAGDTVAATLALGLAAGGSMREAAVLANQAAGIVVGKVGTACVSAAELLDALAVTGGQPS